MGFIKRKLIGMTAKLTKDIISSANKGATIAFKNETVEIDKKSAEYIEAGLLIVSKKGSKFCVKLEAVDVDENKLKEYLALSK